MRYFSDVTQKFYDSEKDCVKAEKIFEEEKAKEKALALEKSAARKEAAKKVEDAYNAMTAARKAYHDELTEFCRKYGSFHMTLDKNGALDWIDTFWDRWF